MGHHLPRGPWHGLEPGVPHLLSCTDNPEQEADLSGLLCGGRADFHGYSLGLHIAYETSCEWRFTRPGPQRAWWTLDMFLSV